MKSITDGAKSFSEWSSEGWRIKKGSKAVGRSLKGECLFNAYQVYKPTPVWVQYEKSHIYDGDVDYDDPMNWDN